LALGLPMSPPSPMVTALDRGQEDHQEIERGGGNHGTKRERIVESAPTDARN
jgi:hypothetical protein